MNPYISIVIPTKNRPDELKDLLNSIMKQTITPKEIIIVDDSEDEKTSELVKKFKKLHDKIEFKYIKGKNEGTTQARNTGLLHSLGELCCFIDDDVVLDIHYLEEITKFFMRKPYSVGVQGYSPVYINIYRNFRRRFMNAVLKTFLLSHIEAGKMRVLVSGHVTFPYNLEEEISCTWMSCTNSCYKKDMIKYFKFDENLKGYALWDDVDFSFRIQKKYPNSLYVTPFAKIVHKKSPLSRPNQEFLFYALIAYNLYFLMKNLRSVKSLIAFVWSQLGMLILNFNDPKKLITLLKVYMNVFRNVNKVIRGRFIMPK